MAAFRRMWRSTLVALALLGALAAPAQATVRKGTGTDPAADAVGGNAANDIVALAAQADDASGAVEIDVGLSATPGSSYVYALLGTSDGSSCDAPAVLFVGRPSTGAAFYQRDGSSDVQAARMSVDDHTVKLSAADPGRLAVPFDCAVAGVSPDGGTNNFVDETALVRLVADAPPAATPTPAPTATPGPVKATTPPVAVPKSAKLTATLGGVPSTIKRNRTITLKLVLADDGSKPTGPITVTVVSARGVSATRTKLKAGKLKPAQRRTLKLRVKLTRRARASTTLRITARAGKLKATSSVLLRIGKAKKVAPGVKKGPLVGTYWWRTVNHADYAWDNRAFYFVDDRTVYSGLPENGLPTNCTMPPAKPAEEVDKRDGCLPYTYDASSGALTIGDKTGTYKPGSRLVLDGNPYSATVIPAAGARYSFADHEHFDFEGLCGLVTGCTVTKKFLTLTPDGQFVLSHSTTATIGDPGLGPYTAVGSYPPDQHGTYAVLAGGKIHLAFADGTARDATFAVLTKDDTLQPDPVGEGVFVGVDNYYPDPFP